MIKLDGYQLEAIRHMKNGCILCGGVGSGKSRTALAYYFFEQGGLIDGINRGYNQDYIPMNDPPRDLYIITTAKKRDSQDWENEMVPFLISKESKLYNHKVIVDSWNNISKYKDVFGAFFIFDEQRVVGRGAWVKAFLNIARKNNWILLSATPGDTWSDYVPVFIANGFYKNRTDFERQHVVYSRFTKYPKIDRYIETGKLMRLRKSILVTMDYKKSTASIHNTVITEYDNKAYLYVTKERKNYETGEPILNASEYCNLLRKICNSDPSRISGIIRIVKSCNRAIIFYNYDYELEILKRADYGDGVVIAEYNGHVHQNVPIGDKWVYLVQYMAGNEAWNCITTDTIIFYSENYSYKIMTQAAGRIDRRNTPYDKLYYYHFKTRSLIDCRIALSLQRKKKFNEADFFYS